MDGPKTGLLIALLLGLATGCGYVERHDIMRDATTQIWLAEESQVKVRNAQSRVFDGTDRVGMLEAVVTTLQDIGFQIEVLDETLGIVSAKRYVDLERPGDAGLQSYLLYDEESLVVLNRSYRTWGPFQRRSDLVRLTVTVRPRNASQLIVRASAQFALRPVEDPSAYQGLFAALERALLHERSIR
ncbi:MAG: hypothetical protein R3F35_16490 [Myxococcota bacterium]